MKNVCTSLLIAFIFLFIFSGCISTSKNSRTIRLNIPAGLRGNFTDDYSIKYTITDSVWLQHPNIRYHLLKYDTAGQYFIAKNAATNPSEAGLYTRIDIMHFDNMEPWMWGFCLTVYNAKTVEDATARATADRNNPKKGCGGYPFSRMKREE